MAFTVEDGTGVAGANSFASVAYADAYFAERGITSWVGVQAVKEAALVRATDYINNRWRFKGDKVDDDQSLEFPRDEAGDLPAKLLMATAEYALRALTGPLAPDLVVDDSGLQVASKKEKVGPLEEETSFVQGYRFAAFKPYPAADMLMRDLILRNNSVIRN